MDPKNQLIHELSNLLSYTSITAENSGMGNAEKRKINKWIWLAGLLIHFENLFTGRKIKLSESMADLPETLKLVIAMNKSAKKGAGIEFENPNERMFITADSTALEESLDLFIKYLADARGKIQIKTYPRKSALEIRCEGNATAKIIKTSPYESLRRENLNNMEIPLQLALELFSILGIEIKTGERNITLKFKKM